MFSADLSTCEASGRAVMVLRGRFDGMDAASAPSRLLSSRSSSMSCSSMPAQKMRPASRSRSRQPPGGPLAAGHRDGVR